MAKEENISFWNKVKKFFKRVWFKISGFFVKTIHEMKRMRWTNKKTLVSATGIVLSFIFLFGLYIIFDDFIIAQIFRLIY